MTLVRRVRARVVRQLSARGSTRPAGLLRIALAALVFAKWGRALGTDQILSPWWLVVFGLAMLLSTMCMLVGFYSRISTGLTALGALSIAFGLNVYAGWQTGFSHHEACLACCVAVLALQPSGGSYSVDRWRTVRRAEAEGGPVPPEEGPLWAWPLMGLVISTVYFYGAVVKCHLGYVRGDRLEQVLMYKYLGSDLPRGDGFKAAIVLSAVGSVALEFSLAFGLWFRRFRWPLMIAGAAFHAVIYATMTVYTFSLTMVFMYLAFFPPDTVHRELDRLHGPVRPRVA